MPDIRSHGNTRADHTISSSSSSAVFSEHSTSTVDKHSNVTTLSSRCAVMLSRAALLVAFVLLGLNSAAPGLAQGDTTCLIDPRVGYADPKNVYTCKFPSQSCCVQFTKPSCCGSKPTLQIVREQVTLWAGLFGILFLIASIVYCRKNDVNVPMCVAFKQCLVKCCLGSEEHTTPEIRSDHTRLVIAEDNNNNNNFALKQLNTSRAHENNVPRAPGGWRKNTVQPMDAAHTQVSNV